MVVHLVEQAVIVLHQSPNGVFDQDNVGLDITPTTPNLVLLSLCEPLEDTDAATAETFEPARVSLVEKEDFQDGIISVIDPAVAEMCFATVINPYIGEAHILDAAHTLALIARGIVLQAFSGMAAAAATHLDMELRLLAEEEANRTDEDPEINS